MWSGCLLIVFVCGASIRVSIYFESFQEIIFFEERKLRERLGEIGQLFSVILILVGVIFNFYLNIYLFIFR